jgi:hypothetical protein
MADAAPSLGQGAEWRQCARPFCDDLLNALAFHALALFCAETLGCLALKVAEKHPKKTAISARSYIDVAT